MPKLLVLFDSGSDDLAPLADAVAEGARGVRFAEVDVRRLAGPDADATTGSRHRVLESMDALGAYDGIIVGAADAGSTAALGLASLQGVAATLINKVGSAFAPAQSGERRAVLWSVLTPMADRGMILVPPPLGEAPSDELESARQTGKRVADVVGWVTHARSHHHHH